MTASSEAQPSCEGPYAAPRRDQRIGNILGAEGKLDTAQIRQVLMLQQARRGLRFGHAAVNLGLITQDDLHVALAKQFGVRRHGSVPSPEAAPLRNQPTFKMRAAVDLQAIEEIADK